MDPRNHVRIPAGTLNDLHTGRPVTPTRDYTHGHFPAMELDSSGVRELMLDVLPGMYADILAAEAEEAAEAAEALACNCMISGGDLIPACCQLHGIPCEDCGGLESCKPDCGDEATATESAS